MMEFFNPVKAFPESSANSTHSPAGAKDPHTLSIDLGPCFVIHHASERLNSAFSISRPGQEPSAAVCCPGQAQHTHTQTQCCRQLTALITAKSEHTPNHLLLLHCQVLHLVLQVACAANTTISACWLSALPNEDASLTAHTDHGGLVRTNSHTCTAESTEAGTASCFGSPTKCCPHLMDLKATQAR